MTHLPSPPPSPTSPHFPHLPNIPQIITSLTHLLLLPIHLFSRLLALLPSITLPVHVPPLLPSYAKESPHPRFLPFAYTPASTPTGLLSPSLPSSDPLDPTPTGRGRGRGRKERTPLTLHVPPSYKSLSLAPNPLSPRPILKVRTPSDWSELNSPDPEGSSEGEGSSELDCEEVEGEGRRRAGRAHHEREGRDERVIRFDSVPEVWWIERAERRRSISRSRHPKEEPSIWESWFSGMTLPSPTREAPFGARMRYDAMIC